MQKTDKPLTTTRRWFDVRIPGFDVESFFAVSRSQAMAKAVQALQEAGYPVTIVSIGRVARVRLSEDQGDPRTPEFGVGA